MLVAHTSMVLPLTGLATARAIGLFLAPDTMTRMLFRHTPADALSFLIARHWEPRV